MIKLFKTFISENPDIWDDELKAEITASCRKVIEIEDNFIDLAFEMGGIEGLEPQEVKNYIRWISDRRLQQLDLEPINAQINKNPLPWMDEMLNGAEHTNFFENRATEYSKASTQGTWEEVFAQDIFSGNYAQGEEAQKIAKDTEDAKGEAA